MYQYTSYPYNNRRNFLKSFSNVTILTEKECAEAHSCGVPSKIGKVDAKAGPFGILGPDLDIPSLPGYNLSGQI